MTSVDTLIDIETELRMRKYPVPLNPVDKAQLKTIVNRHVEFADQYEHSRKTIEGLIGLLEALEEPETKLTRVQLRIAQERLTSNLTRLTTVVLPGYEKKGNAPYVAKTLSSIEGIKRSLASIDKVLGG